MSLILIVSEDSSFQETLREKLSLFDQDLPLGASFDFSMVSYKDVEADKLVGMEISGCILDSGSLKSFELERLWNRLSIQMMLPTAIVLEKSEQQKVLSGSVLVQSLEIFYKNNFDSQLFLYFLRRVLCEERIKENLQGQFEISEEISHFSLKFLQALQTDDSTPIQEGLFSLSNFLGIHECALYSYDSEAQVFNLLGSSLPLKDKSLRHALRSWKIDELSWLAGNSLAGQTSISNSLSSLPFAADYEREEWTKRGVESIYCQPFMDGDRLLGHFFAASKEEDFFIEQENLEFFSRVEDTTKDFLIAVENKKVNESHIAQFQHELHEIEARYHSIFNSMNLGVTMGDQEGRFIFVNSEAHRLFGRKEGELIGHKAYDIFFPEEVRKNNPLMEQAFVEHIDSINKRCQDRLNGHQEQYRDKVFLPNGETRILEVFAAPLRMADGSIVGSIRLDKDITEKVEHEESLLDTFHYAHFHRVAKSLVRELASSTSGLSLEISSLFDQDELVNSANFKNSSNRILEIVDNISSKIESLGQLDRCFGKRELGVDLNAFIAKHKELIEAELGDGVELQMILEDDLPLIRISPADLHRVLFTLLIAQVKLLKDENQILLRTHFRNTPESDVVRTDQLLPGKYVSLTIGEKRVGIYETEHSLRIDPNCSEVDQFELNTIIENFENIDGQIAGFYDGEDRRAISASFPLSTEVIETKDNVENMVLSKEALKHSSAKIAFLTKNSKADFSEAIVEILKQYSFEVDLVSSLTNTESIESLKEKDLVIFDVTDSGTELLLRLQDLVKRSPRLRVLTIGDSKEMDNAQLNSLFPESLQLVFPFRGENFLSSVSFLLESPGVGTSSEHKPSESFSI